MNDCGVLPYDSEIISLLRRIDRDDDGVLALPEFEKFLARFDRVAVISEKENDGMTSRRLSRKMRPLRSPSRRKVVHPKIKLIQSTKRTKQYNEENSSKSKKQYRQVSEFTSQEHNKENYAHQTNKQAYGEKLSLTTTDSVTNTHENQSKNSRVESSRMSTAYERSKDRLRNFQKLPQRRIFSTLEHESNLQN